MNIECAVQSSLNDDKLCLTFIGSWTIQAPSCDLPDTAELFTKKVKKLCFSTEDLKDWDSRLLVELTRITEAARSNSIAVDDHGLPDGIRTLLRLTRKKTLLPPDDSYRESGILEEIGKHTLGLFKESGEMLAFTGEILLAYLRLFSGRARFLKKDFIYFFMTVVHRLYQL